MKYGEVVVEIAHENVAKLFTYSIPEGMALLPGMRVCVPFGSRKIEGYLLRIKDEPGEIPSGKLRGVIARLEDYPALRPELINLAMWMSESSRCLLVEALRLMLPAQMRGGHVRIQNTQMARLQVPEPERRTVIEAHRRAPNRVKILEMLLEGDQKASTLRAISAEGVRNLCEKGIIALYNEETLRKPFVAPSDDRTKPKLTDDQCRALDVLIPALHRGDGKFLLSGVTGSGKTEVYIRAVREALRLGKSAIVLVPEIALTPQMVSWFHSRFGESAAVLHSRLSAGERFDEWRRIRRGDARVVIGARSAVFAPVDRLGVLIVDEEHENTYLSDKHPRYDAREVAQRRCETEGATLLLASATPSLKSFARTMSETKNSLGPLELLEMPRRVNSRPMPDVD
ncbi:MAG: DEAD/DEAH box helicase, partial [Clostridia bacterium]|nr:DEAD/DEAH box helicase [Clostridia bacterium]